MRRPRERGKSPSMARIVATFAALLTIVLIMVVSVHENAALAQTPFGASRVTPETGFVGWLLAQQAVFYRALSGAVRAAKTDGSALWTLMGIAFAYGVFHAAGPGHGKAVISSYLLANDETWRRGVALSFASALLQSLTAVLIVGIAAALLGATAQMMGDAARTIELISYALIVLLGARLLWVKGLGFIRAARQLRDRRHHLADGAHHSSIADAHRANHDHGHAHDGHHSHDHGHRDGHDHEPDVLPWGHAHGPEPQDLNGPGGWKRGLSAIVAVGLRPCSGAIILLVFALSQGLFWAGAVSTFVMGLGTAITVALIATIAVGAKAFVKRYATDEISLGSVLVRGMEVGAAGLIVAFGSLLLAGYMAAERLAFF
jgi:nickel/cobalt exporter